MRSKLPCGCAHDDLYWLVRCDAHTAEDAIVSARWADDRANPPKVLVHRINGIVQATPKPDLVEWAKQVGREADARMTQQLEAPCPEPTPLPTNGLETITQETPTEAEQIDYSAVLNLL